MNISENNFPTILKDATHPQGQLSSLVSPDWTEIFSTASKQNLLPFVYNAAAQYDTFSDYDEAHPDAFVRVTSIMSRQIQKTDAFLDLYRAFIEAREPTIVLKGIICRSLYSDGQDLRVSGDEDLLVDEANFERISAILERCGYHGEEADIAHMETLQEVTFINKEASLAIELHINPPRQSERPAFRDE